MQVVEARKAVLIAEMTELSAIMLVLEEMRGDICRAPAMSEDILLDRACSSNWLRLM